MDFILVFLEPNQPPAADAHAEKGEDAAKYHSCNPCAETTIRQRDEEEAASSSHQSNCERHMTVPRLSAELATEYWEQSEYLDGEERERKYVCCGGQS